MIVILAGMVYIAVEVSGMVGGVGTVIRHASAAGKFNLLPAPELKDMLWFLAAWITMMFGSIPQQDVFQRVASSKNERIAGNASITGGVLYFCFAFIPMFLAYSATLIDPKMVAGLIGTDPQLILPSLIMQHVPVFAQVMFFGALLSAIKSCASATLLAPSVTFTENILRGAFRHWTDRQFLFAMRAVVLCFTAMVTVFALNTDASIYKMVENAYKVTLVAAIVPLTFGLYWHRATSLGATLAIVFGLATWINLEIVNPDGLVPPQLAGLGMSLAGMLVGSLVSFAGGQKIPRVNWFARR
jgi:Na+/proline symporter